jgi:exosortase/archaeosortase family protein
VTSLRADALGRVALIVAINIVGFMLFQHWVRSVETHAAAFAVHALSGGKRSYVLAGTSVVVLPYHGEAFRAVVTTSCSSLASALAIGCLATLSPPGSRTRKRLAVAVAIAVVVCGNIVRIAASLVVGLVAGRASLVLFHDWVGGVLTFVYTLGGFVLFLYLLLPCRRLAHDGRSQHVRVA